MFRSYEETLNYLYANLPMFQRVGAAALKPDLGNTIQLCQELGNPHLAFKSIHVAGTNGKGSTSHMLASVLQSAGYKTGLYTSPHLKSFTERIRVNGAEVSHAFVVDFVNKIQPAIERIKPSFFEITVAMAFEYFAAQKVDVAVVEVGLGGRLDSTNVITPEVSVITNIGWDHKDILGDTLEKIASEKAGIIKPEVPVVISEQQSEIEEVFIQKAFDEQAPIFFASDTYRATLLADDQTFDVYHRDKLVFESLDLPLKGYYQQQNLPGVLMTIDVLRSKGWQIPIEKVRYGLLHVVSQTNLKGRWQKLGSNPLIICDTGHNQDGYEVLLKQIKEQSFQHLHMVLGMVKDKDISKILSLLPKDANYYFCQANIPRAMEAKALKEQALIFGLYGEVIPDVNEAIQRAKENASQDDFIFIGGSTFVVAEIDGL